MQPLRPSTPSCTRREFLRLGGAGIAAITLLPAWRSLGALAGKPPEAGLDVKIGQMILAGFRGYKLKDKNPMIGEMLP